ncbi:hypothetical protein CV729_04930 [Helicobacter pylori]|uniref:hypothetical protein n=1 Tax=Helicobacter pylori TaxID=210 RepID=UPI0011983FBA|nr:hypothetical protein [Helicobacter pylori]QDY62421.1 hypothetical protein CV729_04930 [Helicobacter pylori]
MVEEIKVGGGLVLALCPCNGDFIGFECLKARLIPHALKKALLWGCRGKISPLIKYSIIKF